MSKQNDVISLLPVAGTITKTGWALPDTLTEAEWKLNGLALGRVGGAMKWWLGDWWAFGESKYGSRKAIVDADDWIGPAFDTCVNAATTCRAFETPRRRGLLEFSHHVEVASLPSDEADKLLDWAEKNKASVRLLRERVKEVKAWLAQGWNASQLDRRRLIEKGKTVVASKREGVDAALIAWADQQGKMVLIDRTTEWGNPFEMPGDGDRDTVCDNYADHYLPYKLSLLRKMATLKGKVLVCWCHPERCHGDHLAEQANDRR